MRPIDADALKELFSEVIGHIAKKPEMNGNLEHMIRASAMVIQMIDDAPTVQPDLDEWCTDCKEYDSDKHCCPRFNRVIRGALNEAQPERKTGYWILDRSGSYCCSKCMEPCAGYIMMKPRDRYCKMCGAKMEDDRKE